MFHFIVGSTNPVKIQAVRDGAALMFGADQVMANGIEVPSGVSAQPIGEKEMIAGAQNRAVAALQAISQADFGVGLEGGVVERAEGMFACAWCVAVNQAGLVGLASTGQFQLPPRTAMLVRSGMELGHADDLVYGRRNSKQKTGTIGILTHDKYTRAQFYAPAVMMALIRFVNAALFTP
jgi:inosine/xanthosine triphosphatase